MKQIYKGKLKMIIYRSRNSRMFIKGMLCDGFICPNCCGFNASIEIEE